MLHPDDIDETKEQLICYQCVGEEYLSNSIEKAGRPAKCSYCGKFAETYTLEAIAECVETAFEHHYYRTSEEPEYWQQRLLADRESSYTWFREGDPVIDAIEAAALIPRKAAIDIQAILDDKYSDFDAAQMGEETPFSSDTYYAERGGSDSKWRDEWRNFEQSLKTEARFFSRTAAGHLAKVFKKIDKLKTTDGRPLVVEAGPDCPIDHLYRGRVFQSDDLLLKALSRPDIELGSPPANFASAGRMNARGISVFYGADEAHVAISEVRPPVGSKVAVARFNIIRRLRLLDLTALPKVYESGSVFDPLFSERLDRADFLRSLGKHITRPIMPNDEAFDYLATQATADFLATENDPILDGIVFPSAQVQNGRNVVLFHKAAKVEPMAIPIGTDIDAYNNLSTEDGYEVDYRVTETVPPTPEQIDDTNSWIAPFLSSTTDISEEELEITLRIDQKSVTVHHVDWVNYHCTEYAVTRSRHTRRLNVPDVHNSDYEF
jgi:RES domain-containing protein